MLRKRKEKSKDSDGSDHGHEVNGTANGDPRPIKSSRQPGTVGNNNELKNRVNLIIALVTVTLITCYFNLTTLRQLESEGHFDLSSLESLLSNSVAQSNESTIPISVDKDRPKVWIAGRNMESGYLRHVIDSFKRIGYSIVDGTKHDWDVLWSHDYPFGKEFFTSLKVHQKVNHFPGSGYITNKVSLATTNMPYIPKAFHLPKEKDKFIEYAKTHPERLWVKKSNNHRGIRIENIETIDLEETGHFVQEFIQNPLLIDEKKFDIGLYVVQTSIDPLRVYIYEQDALLRFCANTYHPFNSSDFNSYVVGDDYTPIWEMPSLSKYFTELNFNMKQTLNIYLRSIGKSPELMWTRIEEAISNVYKEKESQMARLSAMTFPSTTRNFFEMVRFDFLVDEDLNVYLMEANMSPNLSSAHFPQNKRLYEQVIYNLFSLVGLTRLDGLHDWPSYEPTAWNLRVSDKDLAIGEDLCSSDKCFMSCRDEQCRSCLFCLSDKMKLILKDAYLEHNSRWNSKRLIPSTSNHNINPTFGDNNPIHINWFKGKCNQSSDWCS